MIQKCVKLFFTVSVILLFVSLLFLNLSVNAPLDPQLSFSKAIRGGPFYIGYSSDYCKADYANKNYSEINLIKNFVSHYGIHPTWIKVSIHEGIDQIKKNKLHILLGCFVKSNEYKSLIFTRPYYGKQVVAVIKGENQLMTKLERYLAKETFKK